MILQKLRDSAKGQPCTLMIPGVCCCDTETTVLAHLYPLGRSMGAKSPDYLGCFACAECHAYLDQHRMPRADENHYALRALALTWARWISIGLITLPGDPETAKHRPGRKMKKQSRASLRGAPLAGTRASGIRKRMNGKVERR